MKTISNNWSIMRGLRLALGVAALVQAYIQKDIAVGLLAAFLILTAILNIGCCGSKGCAVNFEKSKQDKEMIYEELDAKK